MKYPDPMRITRAVCELVPPEACAAFLDVLRACPADTGTAAGVRAEIIEPLAHWIDADLQSGGVPPHAMATAQFAMAAEALEAECLRCTGRDVSPDAIEALAVAWRAWAHELAGVFTVRGALRASAAGEEGSRGGRAPKRQKWADETARLLAKKARGLSESAAWERLPESRAAWSIELPEADFDVYRDGDNLCAESDLPGARAPRPLKRSTFLRQYFRKARAELGK